VAETDIPPEREATPCAYETQQTRPLTFDLGERAATDDGIPVVISSDAIVEMKDGPEILVHSPDSIDLTRAPLPIIATHRGGQINVGIVDGIRPVGGQARGIAKFGTRPEAAGYRDDVLNGTIRAVSVGYARVKGSVRKDGVLVTTRWMPTHVAMVAEPADINAGFFRSASFVPEVEATRSIPAKPAVTLGDTSVSNVENAAAGASADVVNVELIRPEGPTAVQLEQGRVRGIENLCRANNLDEGIKSRWVSGGTSLEEVSEDLMKILVSRSEKSKPVTDLGMSSRETRQFSLARAIRACADQNWSNAGLEAEASREIGKRLGVVTDHNRFFVPAEIQHRTDLTVASAGAGGYLVGTHNQSFIEMLRNSAIAYRAGVTSMPGLVGNVTVPRQSAAGTNYWLATEGTAITESNQTFVQMALSPKTAGAYTEISRQLLLQSSPSVEAIVTSDLAQVVGLAVDLAVLNGSGSAGQPTGIIGTNGIGAVTGTSIAYAGILEFQSDTAAANALFDTSAYVTTPAVAALLKQRVKFSSTASPLWEGKLQEGNVDGYKAFASNQVPSANILFGDFSKVVLAEWGVLQIEVNPYANFAAGIVGVRAMYSIDVGVRQPAAFSLATSVT
jgi:HK97 family phage major capsid protein